MNLVDEQKQYHPWPHVYRVQVLQNADYYRQWIRDGGFTKAPWIRVLRDPYKRALSSFRQAVSEGYHDQAVGAFLGRCVNAQRGFSFREYIAFLAQLDRGAMNPHEYPQRNVIEDHVTPAATVNVERSDLWEALSRFERDAGIAPMPAEIMTMVKAEVARVSDFHHSVRQPMDNAPDAIFSRGTTGAHGAWPRHQDALPAEIRDQIRKIYAIDFEAYAAVL